MDRAIKKKKFPPGRIILIVVVFAFVFFLAYQVVSRSGTSRYKADPSRMTISKTQYGEFLDYYPSDGEVVPVTTVYLDAEIGGRVEEIFNSGGEFIKKGDPILRLSNDSEMRTFIETENQILENLDTYRSRQTTIAKSELTNLESLLETNYQITIYEKEYNRQKELISEGLAITREEFEDTEDQLNYYKAKRDLIEERIRKEKILNDIQLEQAEISIESLTQSLELVRKSMEKLEVKAPISGKLSSIDAKIGQNINQGENIGQVDILDELKIEAKVDQYYYNRVSEGTKAEFTLDGETYEGIVTKKYDIVDDEFKADIAFVGDPPEGISVNRTMSVNLFFGEPEKSLMVKRGGFYQETGGRWAYLISEDGKSARRVNIKLGRKNPRYVEVLEGLKEGDWIITSGYETYNEADELIFPEPLTLKE